MPKKQKPKKKVGTTESVPDVSALVASVNQLNKRISAVEPVMVPDFKRSVNTADSKDPLTDKMKLILMRGGIGSPEKGGFKQRFPLWKGKLAWKITSTSSAVTPQILAFAIQPSLSVVSNEFVSLATLYDEYKVVGGEVLWNISLTAAATSAPSAIITYDPLAVTGNTAILNYLINPQHCLLGTNSGLTNWSFPVPHSKNGFMCFKYKIPSGSAVQSTSGNVAINDVWVDVADTNASFGYIGGYIEAPQAGVTTFTGYQVVDIMFRCRQ